MFIAVFMFVEELTAHQVRQRRLLRKWSALWANSPELEECTVAAQSIQGDFISNDASCKEHQLAHRWRV
jgi:hypothetical protein